MQTSASQLVKKLLGAASLKLSKSIKISKTTTFIGSLSFSWTAISFEYALAYSLGISKSYVAISIKLSVSYLTALAIAACCVAAPYLGTFMSSVVASAAVSISTFASTMAGVSSKFVYALI